MRSEGRVRFVTFGSYFQMGVASTIAIAMGWGMVTSYHYLTRDQVLEAKDRTISTMSAQYEALSNDFSSLEAEVERKAEQLETRQQFLEDMVGVKPIATPPLSPSENSNSTTDEPDSSDGSSQDLSKATFLEEILGSGAAQASVFTNTDRRRHLLTRLKELDDRQRQVADALLSDTNARMAAIDTMLGPIKIDNATLIEKSQANVKAMGGPFEPTPDFQPVFSTDDERPYLDLMSSRQRLEMVTMVLDSFPVGKPAEKYYLSSRFGRRRDPIKKTWARHSGLDLAGWPGTAIYATAPGTVVHSGWYGPYGNMVEIDHGNGFKTRYGHMRRLRVKKGEEVTLGQRVGDMGKTGRTTDTHLHYEVWFDGQVRDPMPFMKAANDVLEIQGRHEETSSK